MHASARRRRLSRCDAGWSSSKTRKPLKRLEPVGEGVEPGAEDEDLPHARLDRTAGGILGEAAAHGDEEAQAPPLRPRLGERDRLLGVTAENAKRQRVGEKHAALERLMRRPMPRRAERRAARLTVFHGRRG